MKLFKSVFTLLILLCFSVSAQARSLDEIIIDGIETTTELFNLLLNEPDIKNGDYNIHWLEEWLVKREE